MHASIWKLAGDPGDLLRRYDEMLAEIPVAQMRLHLCLRAPDGIVIVDTCPTREDFESFSRGAMPELLARHGLPEPEELTDFPVHLVFVDGAQRR